ncbi:esterase [Streptomyces sp. SID13666]|uniref:esterase n=1 Tax=unclassified Streptomyces TaxID=2593676 RepID=UPI0013C04257|nr:MULTISPECIES: esterase [unclassified Streptomyces]NEA56606.1 esterase [Streptomyces sp. SID13666]NEA73050.1 esterase [Streptomyces sp. SID13588]
MPDGVSGVLVQRISARPEGPLDVSLLPANTPGLPLGRIRLHWEPASHAGWNVTAHLGLATTEVLLASWPAAPDDWPRLVRPTVYEVIGLCAALSVATAALNLSNRLAEL